MQILTAKSAGFCEGVSRAYKIALDIIKKGKPTYILGHLVHNTQVVKKLESTGVKSIEDLAEIADPINSILMISAHGVSPDILERAKALKLEIVDTTCAWVKKAQKVARELAQSGFQVIILGDLGHPEVKGLKGWAGQNSLVVQNLDELKECKFEERVGLIAQTTQSQEKFETVAEYIKSKVKTVEARNTICDATAKRQNAATQLAREVDIMLIIGDFKSANTKRLTELCSKVNPNTYQIQTVAELKKQWLEGKEKIGITAGASTPDWVIEEVVKAID
jgi:4-hydroxy-3-methylbut-2-enyl diphosphate reductase